MQYKLKEREDTENAKLMLGLEPVVEGLGLSLVEFAVSRHKGSVSVKATVFKKGSVGIGDCSKVHRAITPRLELAFGIPGSAGSLGSEDAEGCRKTREKEAAGVKKKFSPPELYIEVSSPGINRLIREGAEFRYFIDCPVKCWMTALSDWKRGIVESVTETHIMIKGSNGMEKLEYESIAKAKLDSDFDSKAAL
ncbi:MAG: ribosome assembly cofactor RimP [Spirochaetaceae bacterium]|nr:ribosome assembly cofactor RimP [Spirochaetaceae bacterium]